MTELLRNSASKAIFLDKTYKRTGSIKTQKNKTMYFKHAISCEAKRCSSDAIQTRKGLQCISDLQQSLSGRSVWTRLVVSAEHQAEKKLSDGALSFRFSVKSCFSRNHKHIRGNILIGFSVTCNCQHKKMNLF